MPQASVVKLELTVDEGQSIVSKTKSQTCHDDTEDDSNGGICVTTDNVETSSHNELAHTSNPSSPSPSPGLVIPSVVSPNDVNNVEGELELGGTGRDMECTGSYGEENESAASEVEQSSVNHMNTCNGCGKSVCNTQLSQCSGCRSVRYCGRECQLQHREEHKVLCNAIQYLQNDLVEKVKQACTFASHITPQQRNKLVNLIGERCLVDCEIGGSKTEALWDTGSQVCLVSKQWLKDNGLGHVILNDISEALGTDIQLEGVGGKNIPYEGFMYFKFKINENSVFVPFLVSKENIQNPIIGYNVISFIAKMNNHKSELIKDIFRKSGKEVDEVTVSALIAALQSSSEELSTVTITKKGTSIKAGTSQSIACKIKSVVVSERTPIMFEPEVEELLPSDIALQSSLMYLKKGNNT